MSIQKTCSSFIASIIMVVLALLSAMMIISTIPSKSAQAVELPVVEGNWNDNITRADNPRNKSYNTTSGRNGTTPETAFLIMSATDLAYLSWAAANRYGYDTEFYYQLGADIDLASKAWTPIGSHASYFGYDTYSFLGAIDGTKYDAGGNTIYNPDGSVASYKIMNMAVPEYGKHYMGLIGYSIGINEFTNITFENAYLQQAAGYYRAGVLAGRIQTTYVQVDGAVYQSPIKSSAKKDVYIDNVKVSGYLGSSYVGSAYIGGLVGEIVLGNSELEVSNCTSEVEIQASSDYAGGFVGGITTVNPNATLVSGTWTVNTHAPDAAAKQKVAEQVIFTDCNNYGAIDVAGAAGGIVGYAHSANFFNCNNYADIVTSEARTVAYTGGIVGQGLYNINMDNCHNEGDIYGYHVGGLLGYISDAQYDGYIKDSHNQGAIAAGYYAGGLVGYILEGTAAPSLIAYGKSSSLTITDSYNIGNLDTINSVGGLIANHYGKLIIEDCYNTASVENATTGYAGGLVGLNYRGGVLINNSYNTGDFNAPQNVAVGGFIGLQFVGSTSNVNQTALTDQEVRIINSYNLGEVTGNTNVGGFAGQIYATLVVDKSYNAGAVQGGATSAGGFVGNQQVSGTYDNTDTVINQSYNIGELYSNSVLYVGGLIGQVSGIDPTKPSGMVGKDISFTIRESYSVALATAATSAGGLVGRFAFVATHTGYLNVTMNFELSFAMQNDGNTLPLYNTNVAPSARFIYNIDQYKTVELQENGQDEFGNPIMEPVTVSANLSRMLTMAEFKDINTFKNIVGLVDDGSGTIDEVVVGYDVGLGSAGGTTWVMPDARNATANRGFPFLREIAGYTVNLWIGGVQETYYGAVDEQFSLIAELAGKTFNGWSTLPAGAGVVYTAGDIVEFDHRNLPARTLYAMFTDTAYYDIKIADIASGGALAATYATTDASGSYSLTATASDTYVLSLDNPAATDFVGWQVWKPIGTGGEWYSLTTDLTKNFNLLLYVDQSFVNSYLIAYTQAEMDVINVGSDYKSVGYFMFRAAKQYDAVTFSAKMDTTQVPGDQDLVGTGKLNYNGQNAALDEMSITSFPAGSTVQLEALPSKFHELKSMKIHITYKLDATNTAVTTQDVTASVVNNILDYIIPVEVNILSTDYTVVSFVVEVRFEKIAYGVVVKAWTRDGLTDLTAQAALNQVYNQALILNRWAHVEYTTQTVFTVSVVRYEFVGYKIWNAVTLEYDFISSSTWGTFVINNTVDPEFLESYATGSVINVTAVYAETFLIVINTPTGGTLEIYIVNPNTAGQSTATSLNGYFEKGTEITVVATPSANYEFSAFSGHAGVVNGSTLNEVVSQGATIVVSFAHKVYQVIILYENALTKARLASGFSAELDLTNTEVAGSVRVGSIIEVDEDATAAGFRFVGFYLRNAAGDVEFNIAGENVDTTFLASYLTLDNKINIIAKYMEQYSISTYIDLTQTGMGTVLVEVWNKTTSAWDETSLNEFDAGTQLQVTATSKPHFDFTGFTGIYEYELYASNIARINLSSDKVVQLEFAKTVYSFVQKDKIDGATATGKLTISKASFNIGDTITIMYSPPSSHNITGWKINGKTIEQLKSVFGDDVSRNGDTVTIKVSANWFNTYNTRLENDISTGLIGSILYTIVGASVVIPVLIIILVVFFVLNAKKKKLVTAELKDKQATNYKMNTSSFIQDLREGKSVGQVTDADVKAEMKRRKKEGKK